MRELACVAAAPGGLLGVGVTLLACVLDLIRLHHHIHIMTRDQWWWYFLVVTTACGVFATVSAEEASSSAAAAESWCVNKHDGADILGPTSEQLDDETQRDEHLHAMATHLRRVFCLPTPQTDNQKTKRNYGFYETPSMAHFPFATPIDAVTKLPDDVSAEIECADTGGVTDPKHIPPKWWQDQEDSVQGGGMERRDVEHTCSITELADAYLHTVAAALQQPPRHYAKTTNILSLPYAYQTVPSTTCTLLDAQSPQVAAVARMQNECVLVTVHASCAVMRASGVEQNLMDPGITAWVMAPDRSMAEVHVGAQKQNHRHRSSTQRRHEQTLTFHACTPGMHALHVRLDALSLAHANADIQPGHGDGGNVLVQPRFVGRAFEGSPFEIDVSSSHFKAAVLERSRTRPAAAPPCDLGRKHAPRSWRGNFDQPQYRRDIAFRWVQDAQDADDLLFYHVGNRTSTRRFSSVVHLPVGVADTKRKPSSIEEVVRARRAMRGNESERTEAIWHMTGEHGALSDERGGFIQMKDFELGLVGGQKQRWHAFDRFEAHPSSSCRLCRHDYDSAFRCLRGHVLLLVGDSTTNRIMQEMMCALSIGNASAIYGEPETAGSMRMDLEKWKEWDEVAKKCMTDQPYTCRLDHFPSDLDDEDFYERSNIVQKYPCFDVRPPHVPEDAPRILYASIERFLGTKSRQLSEVVSEAASLDEADSTVYDSLLRWKKLLRSAFGERAGMKIVFSAGLHDMTYSRQISSTTANGASILARRSLDVFNSTYDSITFALANAYLPLRTMTSNCSASHMNRYDFFKMVLDEGRKHMDGLPSHRYRREMDPRLYDSTMYGFPGCVPDLHRYAGTFRLERINNAVWRRVVAENRARHKVGLNTARVVDYRAMTSTRYDSYGVGDAVHPSGALVDEQVQLLLHGACGCDDDTDAP